MKELNRKRDERKAQKVEEKKRQEAHNKRMAELRMQVDYLASDKDLV